MALGEARIKQAVKWIDEKLAERPDLDRTKLLDEAGRRFDLTPVEADFLFRHLAERHAGGVDLDRLVAWGRKRAAPRVLDVATGGGHTALAFAGFTPTLVSVDLT